MVYRVYAEKKPGQDREASSLCAELKGLLGIRALTSVRVLNRYDVENITPALFAEAVRTVFSEPQLDNVYEGADLPAHTGAVLAVEYLPGQFDQRADSAAQCIQIISRGDRPAVRTAKIYILDGKLTDGDLSAIKKYVINPVEAREASLDLPETLNMAYTAPAPVRTVEGFTALDRTGLSDFVRTWGLAMDTDDIAFCQDYFRR